MTKTAYRVRTQEAYDDLMRELEAKGYRWWDGAKPTERNVFSFYRSNTIVLCTLKEIDCTALTTFETFRGYPEYNRFEYEPRQEEAKNMVNHPDHYNIGGIETLDIIEMMLTPEEYRGYLKGSIIKYRERHPYKGNSEQDLDTARFYWERLYEEVEE